MVYDAYTKVVCTKIISLLTSDFYIQSRWGDTGARYDMNYIQDAKMALAEEVENIIYEDADGFVSSGNGADYGIEGQTYLQIQEIYLADPHTFINSLSRLVEVMVDALVAPVWDYLNMAYWRGIYVEFITLTFRNDISVEIMFTRQSALFINEVYGANL